MIMLSDSETIVYTPEELASALSNDNGIDYVYLGRDIIMTAGIRIHSAKTNLVIDGLCVSESPNPRTLSDSGTDTGQINVYSSQNLALTFQNMTIAGRNYYGMPRVYDYSGAENVTVTYNHVTYIGPQMTWHVRGLARYINCDITIEPTSYSPGQEVAEINRVEIGGQTTIRKTNQSDAVFFFYGNSSRPTYFTILQDANVTIDTIHYFIYEFYPPVVTIEESASFTLNTNSGFVWDSAHSITSFTVMENASFAFTQAQNRGVASIYIMGALTVNEGASFYMQADFENNNRLIRFTSSSSRLYLNNPRSFALYNRGSAAATAFYFSTTTPFSMTCNQVNHWLIPKDISIAGTLEDTPQSKWNRQTWAPFELSGTASNSLTTVTYNDFTAEDLALLPPLSDLQLHTAKVFSVGTLPLTVNPVIVGTHPITGTTGYYAMVRIVYTQGGLPSDSSANEDGFFSVTPDTPVPFSEVVVVSSNIPFLISSLSVVSREDGELIIKSAPLSISFKTKPISYDPNIIFPRQPSDEALVVSDTRADKTAWQILAKITGPLTTEDNDVLDDAVVFGMQDGILATLGEEFQPVHIDGPYPSDDDIELTWAENRGVLARITVPVRCGKTYTTQMVWDIQPLI